MPKGERLRKYNLRRTATLLEKQLLNYEVTKTGCWVWQGGKSPDGYGKVKRGGRTLRAHRVFFEHHKGTIPQGLWVLHKCDEPLCVNPDHLWLGTQKDNEADKDRKGRRPLPAGTKFIEFNGEVKHISEWERTFGFKRGVLQSRLLRGWSFEKAATWPTDKSESQKLSQTERLAAGTLRKNAKGQYQNYPEAL